MRRLRAYQAARSTPVPSMRVAVASQRAERATGSANLDRAGLALRNGDDRGPARIAHGAIVRSVITEDVDDVAC